jgi:hypothetical protein
MEAESFFARWSKRKSEASTETPDASTAPAQAEQPEQALPPPTLEDVSALTPQSDYTRFIAKGVDENVRRSAFKKLFTDPHFNIMDGLDIYIDDYNKFDPIPPAMLAALNHAKGLLDPLSQFEKPLMRLAESEAAPEQIAADEQLASAEDAEATVSAPEQPPSQESPTEEPPIAAESSTVEPLASDTNPSAPNDGAPTPTITKPDDDHRI